jgi:tRNA(Ile)-lysidine synthase TilS/MesJ
MKIERLVHRRVGQALRQHRMIVDGDRILIAASGGVDSSVMAKILAEKQRSLPIEFQLVACQIVTDVVRRSEEGEQRLDHFFADLGLPLTRRHVGVEEHADPDQPMSCFLCAMFRRQALLAFAREQGCSKIAFGHHLDDIIETLLLNMAYKAEISTMPALLELDDHELAFIRPLSQTKESEVKRYAARFEIAPAAPLCPNALGGQRQRVKRLIADLSREDERVRDNLAASLGRVKADYLVEKLRRRP